VERAEDWLYLCAIFSDAGVIDEELNSVVSPSKNWKTPSRTFETPWNHHPEHSKCFQNTRKSSTHEEWLHLCAIFSERYVYVYI